MIQNIIVTGGTGFLGSHFLIKSLQTKIQHAYAIVRGNSEEERKAKLTGALSKAIRSYIEKPNIDDIINRITIVDGDIEKLYCGVPENIQEAMTVAKIHSVWHFAASLNFEEYRRDKIQSKNMDGTANVVDLAEKCNSHNFVYISTAYTCGAQHGDIQENVHSVDRRYSNFYEESKNMAEQIVIKKCENLSLPLTILRPSVVIGNSQTKKTGGSTTGLYGFIREIMRLKKPLQGTNDKVRLFGMPFGEINLIPVDILCDDIMQILGEGLKDGMIYHLSSRRNPKTKRVIDIISEVVGIKNLSFEERSNDDLSSLEKLLEKRTVFYSNYLDSHKNFLRKLRTEHVIDEADFRGFVIEGMNEVDDGSVHHVFDFHKFTKEDGVELNLYTTGDRQKPAVVLINAHGMPAEFLVPLAKALKKNHFVATWETRLLPSANHESAVSNCGIEAHIDDLVSICEYLSIHKISLGGWCTGARVALESANRHPELVDRLLLMNGSFNFVGGAQTEFERNMEAIMPRAASNENFAKLIHASIYTRKDTASSEEEKGAQDKTSILLSSTDPDLIHLTSMPFHNVGHLIRYAKLIAEFNEEKLDDRSKMPFQNTLIISGEKDVTANPKASFRIHQMMENSNLILSKDYNHFSLYNDADYIGKIVDFLEQKASCQENHNDNINPVRGRRTPLN